MYQLYRRVAILPTCKHTVILYYILARWVGGGILKYIKGREGRPVCCCRLIVDYDVPPFDPKLIDLRAQDYATQIILKIQCIMQSTVVLKS